MNARKKSKYAARVNLRAAAAFAALAIPVGVTGQMPRDLIEEALDQPLSALVIEETPIRDALSQVEQKTGLHFVIESDVIDLMPYGESTRISVMIREMSVRTGLTRVLDGLGLRMFVDRGRVLIVPAPVLERIGRRLTIAEIGVLSVLAGYDWPALKNGKARPPFDYNFPPEEKSAERLEQALSRASGPNTLRQLETACEALNWKWRVKDGRVVFESPRAEIVRRLDAPIDLDCRQIALDELLTTLGAQIGVLMKFEPGALQKVAARERAVDLTQRGVSVRQILERLCGNTGLRYEIMDDAVRILAPVEDTSAPSLPTIYRWVRIEVEIKPGVVMDVFVRQDQLPRGLQEAARSKLSEIIGSE